MVKRILFRLIGSLVTMGVTLWMLSSKTLKERVRHKPHKAIGHHAKGHAHSDTDKKHPLH